MIEIDEVSSVKDSNTYGHHRDYECGAEQGTNTAGVWVLG